MTKVNVAEAKKHFSDLLGRVAYGKEEIIIFRRNRPMAKLVPVEEKDKPHLADARGWLPDDDAFFNFIDEILESRKKHTPRIISREE